MPNYDYHCPNCGKVEERSHSIHASPQVACCCGVAMRRMIGTSPIHFKGSGWTPGKDAREKLKVTDAEHRRQMKD